VIDSTFLELISGSVAVLVASVSQGHEMACRGYGLVPIRRVWRQVLRWWVGSRWWLRVPSWCHRGSVLPHDSSV